MLVGVDVDVGSIAPNKDGKIVFRLRTRVSRTAERNSEKAKSRTSPLLREKRGGKVEG
jgi:hypothetical protein